MTPDSITASLNGLPRRGLVIYPTETAPDVVELAKTAEQLGYSNVWFGDSQNQWREAVALMGAAAVSTSRVVIGTGVTNPVTRHPAVFASGWETISELSSGRAAVGIGTGFTALGTIGRKPTTLKTLEARITEFRQLIAGHSILDSDTGALYDLSYLSPTRTPIPVYMAASGPGALRTAGRVADGVILLVGTATEFIEQALGYVRDGAHEVGRDFSDIDIVLWTELAIGDDPVEARDRVRGPVARMVMRWIPLELPERVVDTVEKLREFSSDYDGKFYGHKLAKPEHARLVSDEVVDAFSLAGTPSEIEKRLHRFAELGIHQVAIVPAYGTDASERLDSVRAFAAIGDHT